MGACHCSLKANTKCPKANDESITTVGYICSRANCCVVSELKEFCLLFDIESEITNSKMNSCFEHYVLEHASNDDRSNNECIDSACRYVKEYKSPFGLSHRQQLHGYFYHCHKYEASKRERGRSLHFMQTQATLHTIDIIEKGEEKDVNSNMNSIATSTQTPLQIEGKRHSNYNVSVQISRLLSPLAPAPVTPVATELSESLTEFTIATLRMRNADFCEENSECDRVKALLMFCQNVDPHHDEYNMNINNTEYIERMKSYWDHYSEAHIENYTKMDCMHQEYKSADDDDELCEFMNGTHAHTFQLLMHSHFYHCNIMHEENNRIKYVKETMHGQVIIDKFKPTVHAMPFELSNVLQFGFEWQCCAEMAQFSNPKREMLRNKYVSIATSAWNNLLRQITAPNGYLKSVESKSMQLTVGELVALKMYTDFDTLQAVYRKAYYAPEESERYNIQRQFYHWNELLAKAIAKSRDIITQTLYHGTDCAVSVPTFCGKYHGPLSCTKLLHVAKAFAGNKGRILEIYPSFGRKGLDVSWISRYPDEQEVLYFDATFDIKRIFQATDLDEEVRNENMMTLTILKALQSVNVESTVLSFNEITDDIDTCDTAAGIETFGGLNGSELISIFYLLYLQYKPCEWRTLVESHQFALAKYRDQFAQLTQNVTTIRMECASKLIKYFFSVDMNAFIFKGQRQLKDILLHLADTYRYNIRFETIIKLFPQCKQISIDGDNFDWSLSNFIQFLKKYNLDFSGIQLQDIFIRFNTGNVKGQRHMHGHNTAIAIAKKRLKHKAPRRLFSELAKLGWRFITAAHIHRFGFEPHPAEKPFLILFMNEGRVYARSYSKRMVGNAPKLVKATTMSLMSLTHTHTQTQTHSNDIGIEGDHAIVEYNPKHLFLSKHILNQCHYKDEIITMLRHRKQKCIEKKNNNENKNTFFDQLCDSVETLILYPTHNELIPIFYIRNADNSDSKKALLDLPIVTSIFPNVTDVYLRETTFNQRVCRKLIEFFIQLEKNGSLKLKRIFYSTNKQCADRDVAKLKLRLNVHKWDFSVIEQVAFKKDDI